MTAFVARTERNENTLVKFMSNEQLRAVAVEWMMQLVFQRFRGIGTGP
jgi:hypothetical protein